MTTAEPRTTRDQHEIAKLLAIAKVMNELLTTVVGTLKAEGEQVMRPGDRAGGELPDGTRIGSVTYTKGSAAKPQVTDEAAYTAWVEKHHPEQIQVVRRVYSSFTSVVLGHEGRVINTRTGEVEDVPGITWSDPGKPHLTVNGEDDAAEAVVAAVARGDFNIPDLLAIEAAS